MGYVLIGKVSQLPDGSIKEVTVSGREILLARVGDSFYATDSRCPHMGGKLVEGKMEDTIVTCPRHGSRFDLRDGSVVRWLQGEGLFSKIGSTLKSPRPLKTYNVKVERDEILVEI